VKIFFYRKNQKANARFYGLFVHVEHFVDLKEFANLPRIVR
jgi:hypothetical protein